MNKPYKIQAEDDVPKGSVSKIERNSKGELIATPKPSKPFAKSLSDVGKIAASKKWTSTSDGKMKK